MADWIYIAIGKAEALSWAWVIPEYDKPIIRFIFSQSDVQVVREKSGSYRGLTCVLRTTVSKAKKRFDQFNFSLKEIDRIICDLIEIPLADVELALMDDDEFYDRYPYPKDDSGDEEYLK